MGPNNKRWVDSLKEITTSYNITRHETTNRVPWTVFWGSPPTQFYYTSEETPFWNLTPVQQQDLATEAPAVEDWETTYARISKQRARVNTYVQARQTTRATKLVEAAEQQLEAPRLVVGSVVKVRRETERTGRKGIRKRSKFEAPVREDPGIIKEYDAQNRYLVEFQDGTSKRYPRRSLKLISSSSEISAENELSEEEDTFSSSSDEEAEQLNEINNGMRLHLC